MPSALISLQMVELLVSRSNHDRRVLLWRCDTVACVSEIDSREYCQSEHVSPVGVSFHPHLALLATVGSDPGTPETERDRVIHI